MAEGKTVWVICEGMPVATALDKLRPCTAAELLVHHVLSRGYHYTETPQQGFLDHRRAPPRDAPIFDFEEEDQLEVGSDDRYDIDNPMSEPASSSSRPYDEEVVG